MSKFQDGNGMTALLWAAYRATAAPDPTRSIHIIWNLGIFKNIGWQMPLFFK
jgi:hypothetical protein